MTLTVSPAGAKAIKQHEGLRLEAYVDSVGVVTIGYGHTGMEAYAGNKITKAKAEQLLKADIKEAEDIVNKWVTAPLTQLQFDALCSLALNTGPGIKGKRDGFVWLKNRKHSTILRKLNALDYFGAADEFPKWRMGGGRVLRGLVSRRAAERAMFLAGTPVQDTEDEFESNIESSPVEPPRIASDTGVRATATLAAGGTLAQLTEQLEPLAGYSDKAALLLCAVSVVAFLVVVWKAKKKSDSE